MQLGSPPSPVALAPSQGPQGRERPGLQERLGTRPCLLEGLGAWDAGSGEPDAEERARRKMLPVQSSL